MNEVSPHILLDTDIGGDCDDAGALALLNILALRGEAELLAGTLVSAEGATCDHHHGEEHTCGDHGCGHHEEGHSCGHC